MDDADGLLCCHDHIYWNRGSAAGSYILFAGPAEKSSGKLSVLEQSYDEAKNFSLFLYSCSFDVISL